MEGIEVSKGAGSIRNGPFTNGGVVNFVSSSIPSDFRGTLNLALGGNETLRGRLNVGDSGQRYGWLFETYQFDTTGFKVKFLPFRLCPLVLSISAALVLAGALAAR